MITPRSAGFVLLILAEAYVLAFDVEVSLRAHSRSVSVGDPVYIEVRFVNTGEKAITAPQPHLDLNTFQFRLLNPKTYIFTYSVSGGGGFIGDPGTVTYQPNQPKTHYWYIFLPVTAQRTQAFWMPYRRGGMLTIFGGYRIGRNLTLSSMNVLDVGILRRPAQEMQALEHWVNLDVEDSVPGPIVDDYGLRVLRRLSRQRLAEFASQVRTGEIADLLQLTLQMQDLYAEKDEDRKAGNERLIEWLKKQPDIKRQALTIQTRGIAGSYNMPSTLQCSKE